MNNKIYFVGDMEDISGEELWVFDPEDIVGSDNPSVVTNFPPHSEVHNLTVFNNKLYFHLTDVSANLHGLYVYDPNDIVSTDGTTNNPPRLIFQTANNHPDFLVLRNGKFYFFLKITISGTNITYTLMEYNPEEIISTGDNPRPIEGSTQHYFQRVITDFITVGDYLYVVSTHRENNNVSLTTYDINNSVSVVYLLNIENINYDLYDLHNYEDKLLDYLH